MNMSSSQRSKAFPTSVSAEEEDKEELKGMSSISKAIQKEKTKQYIIWSWGKNKSGELSHGGTANALIPRGVRGLKGKRIIWVSSGAQHSAAVTESGELFVCGSYLHGKLGLEGLTKVNVTIFQPVTALYGYKVKQVECGDYHTLCLMENGMVFTWGGSLHKKLGPREGGKDFRSPGQVLGLASCKVKKVACGDFHSVAVTVEGKIYSWGGGGSFFNKGQCGHGHNKDSESPEIIKSLEPKRVVDVVCGGYHTLALTEDNELYAWGSGLYGECGFGAFVHSNTPKLVRISSKNVLEGGEGSEVHFKSVSSLYTDPTIIIKSIAAGGHHSMILTEDGALYTFGYSAHGQLGLHTTVNQCLPQLVRDFSSIPLVQIAAGWHHSLALTSRGDLYACGHGAWGQLGLGETEIMPNFVHVSALGPKNISRIFSGGDHSWAVLDDVEPERKDYVPPSPLHFPTNVQKSPMKPASEGLTLEDYALLSVHKDALAQSNYYLQVSFTDLTLCHRFARFLVPEKNQEKVNAKVQAFVEELKAIETGILYHRLQEDEDVINPDTKAIESPGKIKAGQYYTLCIVVDPAKNTPPILPLDEPDKASKEAANEGLLGVITNIREDVIKYEKGMDGKLSAWVKHFHRVMAPFCGEQPIFFELRPLIFKE